MNNRIILLCFSLSMLSCELFKSNGYDLPSEKVYVALQAFDQVGIVDVITGEITHVDINYSSFNCMDHLTETNCIQGSSCEWTDMGGTSHCMEASDVCMGLEEIPCDELDGCDWSMNMCMESGGMMTMGNHTPHFIAIDEINHYWFVSNIASGYIGRYNLDTDEFIDNIYVGDSPALMVLNKSSMKLYVSRMMPMGGMMTGSTSTLVQEIDYANFDGLVNNQEYVIDSPAPHGLAINFDGSEIYTVSNTADWLYKIYTDSGQKESVILDATIGNSPELVTQRLKPIQCVSIDDNLLLVSCSAGFWYNSQTGQNEIIPGQIQLWNSQSLTLLDTIQFSPFSTPWHLVNSPDKLCTYIALAGDNLYPGTAGIACIGYQNNNLELIWKNKSEDFQTLHGIDISENEEVIYVSGRGDDYLHVFDSEDGKKIKSIYLGTNAMSAGIKAIKK